jgi:hypothetical protein
MRDGFIHSKGQPQAMIFPDNYPDHPLRGQPKRAEQMLRECGLWPENGKRSDEFCFRLGCAKSGGHGGYQAEGNKELVTGCCTRDVLAKGPDFQGSVRIISEAPLVCPNGCWYLFKMGGGGLVFHNLRLHKDNKLE